MTSQLDGPPVSRLTMALAGAVIGVFAICILGVVAFAVANAIRLGRPLSVGDAVGLLVLALIGYGLAVLSWRLVFNRPNRYGSILGPIGWKVAAIVSVCAALSGCVLIVHERSARPIGAVAAGVVMAVGSWRKSKRLVRAGANAAA